MIWTVIAAGLYIVAIFNNSNIFFAGAGIFLLVGIVSRDLND